MSLNLLESVAKTHNVYVFTWRIKEKKTDDITKVAIEEVFIHMDKQHSWSSNISLMSNTCIAFWCTEAVVSAEIGITFTFFN